MGNYAILSESPLWGGEQRAEGMAYVQSSMFDLQPCCGCGLKKATNARMVLKTPYKLPPIIINRN